MFDIDARGCPAQPKKQGEEEELPILKFNHVIGNIWFKHITSDGSKWSTATNCLLSFILIGLFRSGIAFQPGHFPAQTENRTEQ